MPEAFLQIQNLKTYFPVERGVIFRRHIGTVKAVDGVSLSLTKGEILGLVGESGCGKSTLGRTILQLVPPTEGTVILGGRNLTQLESDALRRARGDRKSTRLNSSHEWISYAVFCLKKKKKTDINNTSKNKTKKNNL